MVGGMPAQRKPALAAASSPGDIRSIPKKPPAPSLAHRQSYRAALSDQRLNIKPRGRP